jgi:hypothetical protein
MTFWKLTVFRHQVDGYYINNIKIKMENLLLLNISFFFNLCGGTLCTAATTGLLYQPRMIGDGDCEEIGGMNIGRGN